jgi:hypothetical protein
MRNDNTPIAPPRGDTVPVVNRTHATLKAIDLLRAAGDDDAADALLLEMDEEQEPEVPSVVVVAAVTEDDGVEGSEVVAASEPSTIEVIEATAAAEVAVVEATAAANIAVMEAAAAIEEAAAPEPEPEPALIIEETDSADDPEPRTSHPFYRPLFGSK